MKIKLAASILSFDLGYIADEAKRIEKSGADAIHIDVMDGHFVNNITMGPDIVQAINRATDLFLDVHLMIYHPYDYIERFIQAGADQITIHFESTEDVEDALKFIRRCNRKAGLSFNPDTPFSLMPRFLPQCDLILLMSVQPGFSGQKFQPKVLKKIEDLRFICNRESIFEGGVIEKNKDKQKKLNPFEIQVDGGVNLTIAKKCIEAGANSLVSGSYLSHEKNLAKAVRDLKNCM